MKLLAGVLATALILTNLVSASAAEMSNGDQAVVEAMINSDSRGAVIGDSSNCFFGFGLSDESGNPLGFFALLPNFDDDFCDNSFIRTNPDGTIDDYVFVHGKLLFIAAGVFLGSTGSDIYYRFIERQDGAVVLNVNGTSGDGGQVRIRFTVGGSGKNQDRSDRIWLENYGYIIGEPGKP